MSLHPVLQVTKAYRAGKHRFTTVGAYSQLDDPLYDQVDNVEVDTMSITAGNVGIGTTLPAHKLHVEGDIYANGTMMASNLQILGEFVTMNTLTSNTEQMIIRNEGTGPALQVTQTGPRPIADFYDDDDVLVLRIADGANVGIGTSTPRAKLDVIGTGIYSTSIGIGTTEVRKALDVIGETIITANLGVGTTTPRHMLDIIGDAIISSALGIGTTTPRVGTQLDVIGNAFIQGNVGIGTDLPSQALEIDGSVIARSNLIVGQATTSGYQSITPDGDDLIVAGRIAVAGPDGSAIYKLGIGYAPPSQGEGTVILSANLGIGTENPRTKLDVVGSALIGNIGIGTTVAPELPLAIYDTTAILLPKGSNSERPLVPQQGYIRYNTDTSQFEGFGAGSVWGSLGGVKSTDQLTYITAEESAGTNDCNLRFFTSGVQQGIINPDGNLGIGTTTPITKLHVEGNVYANGTVTASNLIILGESVTLNTVTSNTERIVIKNDGTGPALQVIQTGAEPVAEFYDNESGITLYVGNDGLIGIGTTMPTVSLTFNETDAILLPKGTTGERPSPGVQGYIRYNSETSQFEGFGAGSVWGSLGGVKSTDQMTYISAELTAGANDSNLRFVTSGSLKAIISPDGNLGIGTTSPQFKLDVEGTTFTEELRTSNLTVYGISHFEMNSSTLRSRVQITPVRQMFYVTTSTQSTFTVPFTGVYSASPSNIMVFVGQTPMFYYSPTVKDYDLSISYVNNPPVHTTEYTITLTSPAIYGDIVDITVWPQLIQESAEEQGYVLQSVFIDETFWGKDGTTSNLVYMNGNVGIGTTAPTEKLDVFGNIRITGHILPSECNVFDLGESNYRFRDLYLSGNTIDLGGTRLSRDQVSGSLKIQDQAGQSLDTAVKSLYTSENVGIGTTVATEALTIYGNILATGKIRASNLEIFGDYVTLNTVTSNTEQIVVTNAGTGPAIKVTQTGSQSIADFYDDGDVLAFRIANGGNVGIGTTDPTEKLHVMGNILASGDIGAYSDIRLKTNLDRIQCASEKLEALYGYTYQLRDDTDGKRHMGLIAQEVKEVAPEVVREQPNGYLSISYGNLTALLVEGLRELRTDVDAIKAHLGI